MGHHSNSALARLGLETCAPPAPPQSEARFPTGEAFRIEIASVETPEAFELVLKEADRLGVTVNRVSQGSGINMLSEADLRAMLSIGRDRDVEVSLTAGARAGWGTGAQARSTSGKVVIASVPGGDGLAAAIDEVEYGCEQGLRNVLVTDIGLLWALGRMRASGDLPGDLKFKVSASFPVANPATAALLTELGADSLNTPVDLHITQLASIRAATDKPLDIYIEGPDDFGAPVRQHEMPELVRCLSPLYLKFAVRNSNSLYPYGEHLRELLLATAQERVRRAALAVHILNRHHRPTKVALTN